MGQEHDWSFGCVEAKPGASTRHRASVRAGKTEGNPSAKILICWLWSQTPATPGSLSPFPLPPFLLFTPLPVTLDELLNLSVLLSPQP